MLFQFKKNRYHGIYLESSLDVECVLKVKLFLYLFNFHDYDSQMQINGQFIL